MRLVGQNRAKVWRRWKTGWRSTPEAGPATTPAAWLLPARTPVDSSRRTAESTPPLRRVLAASGTQPDTSCMCMCACHYGSRGPRLLHRLAWTIRVNTASSSGQARKLPCLKMATGVLVDTAAQLPPPNPPFSQGLTESNPPPPTPLQSCLLIMER